MRSTVLDPSFQQQASRAFGQLVRAVKDAQLRALMRALFYRADRYQRFCQAPLAQAGADSVPGAAVRHAIRVGRLVRGVAGSFSASSQDLMLAAALLLPVGATEAFDTCRRTPRLSARGRLYPVAVLSALAVHDASCTLDAEKRALLESLMLRSAWLAGCAGMPAPEADGTGQSLQHEAQIVALCVQLDRCAGNRGAYQNAGQNARQNAALSFGPGALQEVAQGFDENKFPAVALTALSAAQVERACAAAPPVAGAVRWSQSAPATLASGERDVRPEERQSSHLTLVRTGREEHDDNATEPQLATG